MEQRNCRGDTGRFRALQASAAPRRRESDRLDVPVGEEKKILASQFFTLDNISRNFLYAIKQLRMSSTEAWREKKANQLYESKDEPSEDFFDNLVEEYRTSIRVNMEIHIRFSIISRLFHPRQISQLHQKTLKIRIEARKQDPECLQETFQ